MGGSSGTGRGSRFRKGGSKGGDVKDPLGSILRTIGESNPLQPRGGMRGHIVNNEAIIELIRRDGDPPGHLYFTGLRNFSGERGAGTRAMDAVLKAADKLGITLHGSAVPFGEGGLSKIALRAWYARKGWKFDPNDTTGASMTRTPGTPLNPEPTVLKLSGEWHTADFGSRDS